MTLITKCPSCGFESDEVRCPRCNALKVIGCSGVCSRCSSSCPVGPVPAPHDGKPSDDAVNDAEHTGTPL